MTIDENAIKLATDKKYTEFSDSIKSSLNTKLSNHKVFKEFADRAQKRETLKNIFSGINSRD